MDVILNYAVGECDVEKLSDQVSGMGLICGTVFRRLVTHEKKKLYQLLLQCITGALMKYMGV